MSQTISKQLLKLLPLVLLVAGLLSYNFLSAQWQSPTATAPNNNTLAPINVGISTTTIQNAQGYLVFNRFSAVNAVWSPRYCDELGANCWDPATGAPGGGGIGYNQTWQDVRASRVPGTSYRNNTGKPISVNFTRGTVDGFSTIFVSTDNSSWTQSSVCWRGNACSSVIVPPGHWYQVNVGPVLNWSELR